MEKDEISDIVKKVLEAQEKGKNETTKVEKKEEVVPATEEKSISEVEYENQRIEDIIDRKIDERISMEKENWKKENEDRTGRREASWSLVLGIVSIISSTSLIFAIISGIYAIILCNKAKKRLSRSGVATAGKVTGIVGLSLTAFIYFWVIIAFLANEVFYW